MIIIDTNIILRYLLNDNKELNKKAVEIVDNNDIFIPTEVIVEMSYVLKKVYKVEKEKIFEAIEEMLSMENVHFQNAETIRLAFKTYSEKNFDIVDCMLYAYSENEHYDVKTLDERLGKLIKKSNKF